MDLTLWRVARDAAYSLGARRSEEGVGGRGNKGRSGREREGHGLSKLCSPAQLRRTHVGRQAGGVEVFSGALL